MNRKIKVIFWSIMVLILGISTVTVFAEEDEQEEQELCEGVPELEAEAFLLEQSIIAAEEDGADVKVPLPETSPSSTMVQGEIPSCDEITELVEARIEQLEAYMEENGIELLDEEDMEEIKENDDLRKQEKRNDQNENQAGSDGQSGNDVSASVSQGMPSCEQNTMLLRQRIADLEQFIEDNDLEVPEPSEDEATAIEESEEGNEDDEGSDEETENPPQGFIKGMFKRMVGFFGGKEEADDDSEATT